MTRHTSAFLLVLLASSLASHPVFAADFVPLGQGVWEVSGRVFDFDGFNGFYRGDLVFPNGQTPLDDIDSLLNLTSGNPPTAPVPWVGGIDDAVAISNDGRTILGLSGEDPVRFIFGANGETDGRLEHRDTSDDPQNSFLPIDLDGTGTKSLSFITGPEGAPGIATGVVGFESIATGPLEPPLFNGLGNLRPLKISADGNVVIGERFGLPWRWDRVGNSMTVLNGFDGELATALSEDGAVIVGGPWRWTEDDGATLYGEPPGPNFTYEASDVSADGSVIVGTSFTNGVAQPFLWTAENGMVALDESGSSAVSRAENISADGSTIVGSTSPGSSPWVWNAAFGMRSFEDLLVDQEVDLTGWTITEIADVSADGTVLVGNGIDPNGSRSAWLARIEIIPEPSAMAMFLMAFSLAAVSQRY